MTDRSHTPNGTHTPGVLNICFLECDEPAVPTQKKHGGFDDILHSLLEPILKDVNDNLKLETRGYDVVKKREYPSLERLQVVDCVVVSGSFVADACDDTPWIMKLAGFLLMLADDYPRIRIVGICFGHQLVARAFSGQRIRPNEKGWEVGATELKLTELGKEILAGTDENPTARDTMVIQQIHSDHVIDVPEGFELLASSDNTPVQSLVRFYPDGENGPPFTHTRNGPAKKPWSRVHILTMQGHCEWHAEVLAPLIDEFEADGKFPDGFAKGAHERAKMPDDGEEFGAVILRVLGVYPARRPSLDTRKH